MLNIKNITFAVAMFLFVLSGCAGTEKISTEGPIAIPISDRVSAIENAQDVLVGMQFVIEKYDPEAGVVKARPLRGGQFFEFWRQDNATALSAAEANIHSIQRIAQVSVTEQSNELFLECNVQVRRLSIPEKDFSAVSQAAGMFTTGDASLQRLELNEEQLEKMAWIDLGRDHALEYKILNLIQKKIKEQQGRS
jgi:hypothetical protein